MNNTVTTLAQTQILTDTDNQNPVVDTTNIIDAEYTITSEDIPHELSESKELVAVNDNNFPTPPTDPTALPKYITLAKKYIEAETKLLNGLKLTPNRYHLALRTTQEHASLLLLAELRLSEMLKGIKTCRGMRTDINKKKMLSKFNHLVKSKKEIIKQDFKLSPRQARDIEKLTSECIKKALEVAKENNTIPTRSLALSQLPKREKDETGNVVFTPIEETEDKVFSSEEPLYYTSLFANVGIGTYYLHNQNIHCAVANELLEERAEWHDYIYPNAEMIQGDMTNPEVYNKLVQLHKQHGCKLVLASPPYQSFSKANTSKGKVSDIRTPLFRTNLDFIRDTDTDYALIENVPDFLNAKPKQLKELLGDLTIGEYIKQELENMGYIVNIGVYSAADYGTAQDRKRAIILAAKKELGLWKFPKKDKFRKILFEAIGDLPSLEPGQQDPERPMHYALDLPACQIEFLKHTPTASSAWQNKKEYQPINIDGSESCANFKASFSRKDWNKPSNTILTDNGSIGGIINIHPGRPLSDGTYSDCRPLSILELFRVTGLPDDYPVPGKFIKNDKLIREVIGECFAPLHVARLMTTIPNKNKVKA